MTTSMITGTGTGTGTGTIRSRSTGTGTGKGTIRSTGITTRTRCGDRICRGAQEEFSISTRRVGSPGT